MTLTRTYNFYKRTPSGRCYNKTTYGLPSRNWNQHLTDEFAVYRQWRTAPLNLDRPANLLQRDITFDKTVYEFEGYFGYLVTVQHIPAGDLRLMHLADPRLVRAYVEWHSSTRTKNAPSRYMQKSVGTFSAIAHYYLKVSHAQWRGLSDLRRACQPRIKRDQRAVRNTLATIEEVGVLELPAVTDLASASIRRYKIILALRAQRSLIIRLLVRRPLRSRNIREMKLDHNLLKENGQWWLEFRGEELKVGEVGGRPNVYRQPFPPDLVPQLDEFLTFWRPILPGHVRREVFTTQGGLIFAEDTLNTEVKKAIYAYTGRATNIHQLRHIWATEFILKTQDFITAAEILGDRVETVLLYYADLRRANAGTIADRVLERLTSGQAQESHV